MICYPIPRIWILPTIFLINIALFVGVNQVLADRVLQATPQPSLTPFPATTPIPVETPTLIDQPVQLWRNHGPGNALVNTLLVEDDYIWTGTAGDGVIRWNRYDGTFTQFTQAEGLIHPKVRAITVDQVGHLWFGTEDGLSEFDGQNWTNYTTANGLAYNKVLAIAIDQAGRKWFGTWGGGLSRFDGRRWTTYTRASGLASNYIYTLAIDSIGHLWVGTSNGVNEFDGYIWRTYTTANGLASNLVYAIAVDSVGHKWFGTPAGVSEFDGQSWHTYTTVDGLVSNYIRSIAIDASGDKWFATAYGVSRFDGQTWTTYNRANGLPHSHITAIAVGQDREMWLGTIDGVIEFAGSMATLHTTGRLVGNRIRAIAIDAAGRKWFATNYGVSEYDGQLWTSYTTADGLVAKDVRALAIDTAGRKWFGTNNGASLFDGQTWTTYTPADGLAHNQVNTIAADPSGSVWFGTAGGVSEFDGKNWRIYTTTHGLVTDTVTAIAIDKSGTKWFGTSRGISRFNGQTWTTYTAIHGLPDGEVTSLAIDSSGQVWATFWGGSSGGVRRFNGQTWTDEGMDIGGWLWTVAIDYSDRKWFGTPDGLVEFEDKSTTVFNYDTDGLTSNQVSAIVTEADGKVWVGTDGAGVSELINPDELTSTISPPSATPVAAPILVPTSPVISTRPLTMPFPALLAQITLAPPGQSVTDMQLDPEANRLYVTDSNYNLHILNAATYDKVARLPDVTGLILDPTHLYLYLVAEDKITVRKAESLAEIAVIAPAGRVIFNSDQNQVYVANRIYDGTSLQRVGLLPDTFVEYDFAGRILGSDFNPARNELYIEEGELDGTDVVYSLDPETLQIIGDLLPQVSGRQAVNFYAGPRVFPGRNLIAINSGIHVAGHGAGRDIPPDFMDATTLDEFADLGSVPPLEEGCNDRRPVLARPINGLIYREEHFIIDSSYYNLLVYDLDGNRVTWRDGLSLGRTNPATTQMYFPRKVYDLTTLMPLGDMPLPDTTICLMDDRTGRIYAKRERDLVVFSQTGGQPAPPPPPLPVASLPADTYSSFVQLSPDYEHDHMLFAGANGGIYRSTNNGQTWVQLRGGLPEGFLTQPSNLALSPNFAADHTLFVSGNYGTSSGLGVYRSTDGGDTWQPMWNGLTHLRVQGVLVSPNYATDGTVIAYADFWDISGDEGEGFSIFRSTDTGLNWTLVLTRSYFSDPEKRRQLALDFLPTETNIPLTPVRFAGYNAVEYTTDNGLTWQPLTLPISSGAAVNSLASSPLFAVDHTIYLTIGPDLFRSTDSGKTWERWRYQLASNPVYGYTLAIKAISPLLADGTYRLFIGGGSGAGQFWVLDPTKAGWETVPGESK